jgi:carbamoyltransferase
MSNDQQQLWGIDKLNIPRSDLPAITHIDYSARIQTVDRETNPKYYRLIEEFERLTGCASSSTHRFNVRGEPIVCTPADAYTCFMRTHIDTWCSDCSCWTSPSSPLSEKEDWRHEFQLD